ncbi:A/G-specific adenine glycosylase [Acetobacteraceae bacterium H6797]|nr:A/G-specific adenine glycosylase [Acetobacteraceae bacterium H6797]
MSFSPDPAPLLAWYDRHRRSLPWRALPGERPDPYRVWLSEVMLQQTTVATVGPRYSDFLSRFPTVKILAAAPWEAVAEAWAGLGYYARARNLHACAKAVVALGGFPRTVEGLRALPGIGAYTAAAVGAIAFNLPAIAVDGNVERVTSRLHAVEDPLPSARPRLAALAERFLASELVRERPSDFVQALFDLGATICTPRNPACVLCPWALQCEGRKAGIAATLPRKTPKAARPTRLGVHFLLTDPAGRLLLRRRPESGLLGGMPEIPGTPWREAAWGEEEAMGFAPLAGPNWRALEGEARHGFTHFELRMRLLVASIPAGEAPEGYFWATPEEARAGLPTAMLRLLELAAEEHEGVPMRPARGRGRPPGRKGAIPPEGHSR